DTSTVADAPFTGDSGPCGDILTSGDNCGRCGHSCLGGACADGGCQPLAIRSNTSPRNLAVDKDHVYWLEPKTNRVMQADKDGKNTLELAYGGPNNDYPLALAIDDAGVYWGTLD